MTNFNRKVGQIIEKPAVVLQDEVEKAMSSGIQNKYKRPKHVLDTSGRYVAKADPYSPLRLQVLSELVDEDLKTRKKMISDKPVEVYRIKEIRETVMH